MAKEPYVFTASQRTPALFTYLSSPPPPPISSNLYKADLMERTAGPSISTPAHCYLSIAFISGYHAHRPFSYKFDSSRIRSASGVLGPIRLHILSFPHSLTSSFFSSRFSTSHSPADQNHRSSPARFPNPMIMFLLILLHITYLLFQLESHAQFQAGSLADSYIIH